MHSTELASSREINSDSESNLSFESALTRLQDIVAQLEEGSLTLEESIARFRQGAELASHCQRLIANAELKITTLADATGEDRADPVRDLPQSQLPGI